MAATRLAHSVSNQAAAWVGVKEIDKEIEFSCGVTYHVNSPRHKILPSRQDYSINYLTALNCNIYEVDVGVQASRGHVAFLRVSHIILYDSPHQSS